MTLARGLNMSVTAEGVETREQLEMLRSLGVNFAQGYLLGRPVPRGRTRRPTPCQCRLPECGVAPACGNDRRFVRLLLILASIALAMRLEGSRPSRPDELGIGAHATVRGGERMPPPQQRIHVGSHTTIALSRRRTP